MPGGISDHTRALGKALAARTPTHVLAQRGDPSSLDGVPCGVGVGVSALPEAAVRIGARAVVLQYVPFLYARRGVSPALVLSARRLHRRRIPTGLVLHEPFVPFTRLPWLITGPLQRLQLRALAGSSQFVVSPVPRFVDIARRYGAAAAALAPVGAAWQPAGASRAASRAQLGLSDGDVAIGVFSPAASGYLGSWVESASRSLSGEPAVVWVLMGFGSVTFAARLAGGRKVVVGERPLAELSALAAGLDLFVAPYEDGLTLRRTGAMFGLAHGLPLVSSRGHLFDEALDSVAACARDCGDFAWRLRRLVQSAEARAALAARVGAARELTTQDRMADLIVGAFAA